MGLAMTDDDGDIDVPRIESNYLSQSPSGVELLRGPSSDPTPSSKPRVMPTAGGPPVVRRDGSAHLLTPNGEAVEIPALVLQRWSNGKANAGDPGELRLLARIVAQQLGGGLSR
jgi:hypothetical protein